MHALKIYTLRDGPFREGLCLFVPLAYGMVQTPNSTLLLRLNAMGRVYEDRRWLRKHFREFVYAFIIWEENQHAECLFHAVIQSEIISLLFSSLRSTSISIEKRL